MPTALQTGRPIAVTTGLGPDKLLAVGFSGNEGISQLFQFQVECIADLATDVAFDKILGQKVSVRVELNDKKERFFHGICSRISQGNADTEFKSFRLEVVPQFWLLTRRAQSRIFQHLNVPDILKKVLEGIDVAFELQGNYEKRDFCVQYRETDFNFASRVMEEEGIYYFFKHTKDGHKMVVANTPGSHPNLTPSSTLQYKPINEGGGTDGVFELTKAQVLTSGKFTLWDHTFELPHKHLEADKPITDSVQVGKVVHKLKLSENGKLEVYDWPGEYAQRFDGVDRGGGEQPAELQKIFQDNIRTVDLRMQAAAASAIELQGTSNCRHLSSGFKVTIEAIHPITKPIKADGHYVITSVSHAARMSADVRAGGEPNFRYSNTFTLIPAAVPFRPQRITPKPLVPGTQSAVVVGPKGEEIFTDKFGRVKVQFHWDREGKNDADSSCWIRVSQPWAGKRWGAFFIPRIGQEVIVDFLEGDPDQPIIVGSVYNAEQMHPYLGSGPDTGHRSNHKQDPKLCGVKSNTTPGGAGFNEWRFDDTKGKEQVFIHGERDYDLLVKNDRRERIYGNSHLIVGYEKDGKKGGDQREEVYQNKHLKVHKDQEEHIGGNFKLHVGGVDDGEGNVDVLIDGSKHQTIAGDCHLHVKKTLNELVDDQMQLTVKKARITSVEENDILTIKADRAVKINTSDNLIVGADRRVKIGANSVTDVGQIIHIKAGQMIVIEAGAQLSLKVGSNFIDIGPSGVSIVGTMVNINSGGSPGAVEGGGPTGTVVPVNPEDALEAKPVKPDVADNALSGQKSSR